MQLDSAKTPDRFDNRLLAALPERDRRQILSSCEAVELRRGEVISEPGDRIRDVYFPTDSFVSLVTPPADYAGLEVRLVGNEGMIGTPLVLGVEVTQIRTFVQGAGPAWRLSSEEFGEALRRSDALRARLHRYLDVLMNQSTQLLACTRFHMVEARLARWLLMTQDRAHSDHFHVTHELLALLLGVRRVGVTKAASALQARELIHYRRGDITVLDRAGLQGAACGCYGAAEAMYEQRMG
ncbi:Crp/Fnr family transcriptional regulator [Thiocapsa bogorovii]|uniref:Crp/Fnr family transcriptional regulator n=1 Tax=Thiocapsa bogorovii TaxID=521689 RepID=UPI001E454B9E|nr:Crp/Fnr family transcriptional regulator [Thiocapsa bogorovii]UHD16409.1 Crp/Fnr family transcriptional regulator [Thiocapsa bogorovii]